MKKINIFNRNTNLPSYRRTPVSRGFNRGGVLPFPWERGPAEQPGGMGITPSPLSPTKFLKFCGTRFGATPSWKEGERKVPSYRGTGPRKNVPSFRGNAESPRCCRELVCGKTDGIPLFSGMTVRICGMMIAIAALFVTPSFAEPTELDKKTVASKAYVDTKQDIIETGLVNYYSIADDETKQVPSLVSYDSTNGFLVGNEIGILNYENIYNDDWNLLTGSEMDNFVPTVRAVTEGLSEKQDKLMPASTSTILYYSMASTGGQTIDLRANAGVVGRRYITAGGSQPLTKKSGADNVILYINGTKTLAQYQTSNFGGIADAVNMGQNYIKGALVSLELLKDVYSELNSKITNNALPTGTTGTVVTYNGVNAETGVQEFGERAVYDPANTYNAQTDATKLATAGFVETKQNKMVCAGWDSDTHTDEHCWLWSIE